MNNFLINISFGRKLVFFIFLLLFLLLLFLLFTQKKNVPTVIYPSPTSTPAIQATPLPSADQGQLDYNYNKAINDFKNSHPWYDKIPPANENFSIGFDASKNDFFVELYPKKNSSVSIDEQTNQLKNLVSQTLTSIGVDVSLYKIEWIVAPQ